MQRIFTVTTFEIINLTPIEELKMLIYESPSTSSYKSHEL